MCWTRPPKKADAIGASSRASSTAFDRNMASDMNFREAEARSEKVAAMFDVRAMFNQLGRTTFRSDSVLELL